MTEYHRIYNKETGLWETHTECPRCAENKRLREAVEFAEDVFMGTVPNHPELESGWALAELRRHAVGRGGKNGPNRKK